MYKIEKDNFKEFLSCNIIEQNYTNFIKHRVKIILDRLISIRNQRYKLYIEENLRGKDPLLSEMYEKIYKNSSQINNLKSDKIEIMNSQIKENFLTNKEELNLKNYEIYNNTDYLNTSYSRTKKNKTLSFNNFESSNNNKFNKNAKITNLNKKSFDNYASVESYSFYIKPRVIKINKAVLKNKFREIKSCDNEIRLIQENQIQLSSIINNSIFNKLYNKSIHKNSINIGDCSNYMENITRNTQNYTKNQTNLNSSMVSFKQKYNESCNKKIINLKNNEIKRYLINKNKTRKIRIKGINIIENLNKNLK